MRERQVPLDPQRRLPQGAGRGRREARKGGGQRRSRGKNCRWEATRAGALYQRVRAGNARQKNAIAAYRGKALSRRGPSPRCLFDARGMSLRDLALFLVFGMLRALGPVPWIL